jgi:hypothetical protein
MGHWALGMGHREVWEVWEEREVWQEIFPPTLPTLPHLPISPCPPCSPAPPSPYSLLPSRSNKSATLSKSLSPGARSTPLDRSMPLGFT